MNNEKVKFLLNWNHFSDHLSTCMTKLMTDISYSDIIIATADKHMIYSHRFVLANSSKYFQRLLKNVKKHREIQLVVALPEIKYEIFKILMNYMYKGETQVPHELLPSVIKAGQFLEINGLVNLSEGSDCGGANASLMKCDPRGSTGGSSASGGGNPAAESKKPAPGTLRDKVDLRENAGHGSKAAVIRSEKRGGRGDKGQTAEVVAEENGKENRAGKLSAKSSKTKVSSSENVDIIHLPLKRKAFVRDGAKKSSASSPSSSSVSTDSSPPKKNLKRQTTIPEVFPIKIKTEKEINDEVDAADEDDGGGGGGEGGSPIPANQKEDEDNGYEGHEKITIKVEEPDDVEEVEYNELQCEFCHEVYTNPSEWVKHMTEQHEDRGYQTYKDHEKTLQGGRSTVITCVVCSCICYSATEWANHLKLWHSDRELAVANMSESKKSSSKVKKKSGSGKKQ